MPRPEPNMSRADYLQMHRERRELILAACRAGRPYADIAKDFGISPERVSQIATKAGIRRRPDRLPTRAESRVKRGEILAEVRAGKPYRRIACDHGVTPEYVSMIACKAGIRQLAPFTRRRKASS